MCLICDGWTRDEIVERRGQVHAEAGRDDCNAKRYADRMPQLVTRVDDALVDAIDELVEAGLVASRSDAVRVGLERLIDSHRRAEVGRRIVAGYRDRPQTDDEVGWADQATEAMIAEEPW